MEFAFDLRGTGWAEARVSDGSSSATVRASYLTDALGVLLEAVGLLLDGADQARCSWEDEPGEHRWLFDAADSAVHLRVLDFQDMYPQEPDANGVVIFESTLPLREMARAIADGAQAVLDEHGETEYLRRWVEHPFPRGHLDMIQAELGPA